MQNPVRCWSGLVLFRWNVRPTERTKTSLHAAARLRGEESRAGRGRRKTSTGEITRACIPKTCCKSDFNPEYVICELNITVRKTEGITPYRSASIKIFFERRAASSGCEKSETSECAPVETGRKKRGETAEGAAGRDGHGPFILERVDEQVVLSAVDRDLDLDKASEQKQSKERHIPSLANFCREEFAFQSLAEKSPQQVS
ncbi:hypothetical protein B0H19DRAFT_1057779 [Mycena capillaripes]|nr:hypothetical protein B0H19DRAFT_1057779 [Mycena capillaripes]